MNIACVEIPRYAVLVRQWPQLEDPECQILGGGPRASAGLSKSDCLGAQWGGTASNNLKSEIRGAGDCCDRELAVCDDKLEEERD